MQAWDGELWAGERVSFEPVTEELASWAFNAVRQ